MICSLVFKLFYKQKEKKTDKHWQKHSLLGRDNEEICSQQTDTLMLSRVETVVGMKNTFFPLKLWGNPAASKRINKGNTNIFKK